MENSQNCSLQVSLLGNSSAHQKRKLKKSETKMNTYSELRSKSQDYHINNCVNSEAIERRDDEKSSGGIEARIGPGMNVLDASRGHRQQFTLNCHLDPAGWTLYWIYF